MTKEKIDITKYTKYFKAIFFITAVINILLFAQKKETILEKADYKILVQESEGSSNYVEYNGSTFPKNGYVLSSYECANGGVITQNEAKAITFTGGTDTCTLKFDLNGSASTASTLQMLQALNPNIQVNSGTPDFSQAATTDEGLYSTQDDYGTSYYWRGAATTNYIQFGKNSSNQDLYWRIIRINGDDSLRLLYAGTSANAQDIIGKSAFSTKNNDNGYLGYMYGNFTEPTNCVIVSGGVYSCSGGSTSYEQATENVNSSTMKIYLENWYQNNFLNKNFEKYISDSEFCYDRVTVTNNTGYSTKNTAYAPNWRYSNLAPILTCPQKNDTFTVSDTSIGNGKLTYSIGLLTMDEAMMAGATKEYENDKYYLYKDGVDYYTGSPSRFSFNSFDDDIDHYRVLFYIEEDGTLLGNDWNITSPTINVVPVINISQEAVATLTGIGTSTDPFVVH